MSLPITLLIFFKLILGIKVALSERVLSDNLIPGAIIPPTYVSFINTSKVVAVPKSRMIKFFLLSIKLIAFVILSDPT